MVKSCGMKAATASLMGMRLQSKPQWLFLAVTLQFRCLFIMHSSSAKGQEGAGTQPVVQLAPLTSLEVSASSHSICLSEFPPSMLCLGCHGNCVNTRPFSATLRGSSYVVIPRSGGVRSSELHLVGQQLVPKSCQGCIRHWCRSSEGPKGVKDPSPVAGRPEAGWGLAMNVTWCRGLCSRAQRPNQL